MPNIMLTGKSEKVRIHPDPLSGYLHPGQVVDVGPDLSVDIELGIELDLLKTTTLAANRPLIYTNPADRDADDPRQKRWAYGPERVVTAEERLAEIRARKAAEHAKQSAAFSGRGPQLPPAPQLPPQSNLLASARKAHGRGSK